MPPVFALDEVYREILMEPLRGCRHYRPAFGGQHGEGVSFQQFSDLYSQDPLYHWIGLDTEAMYAAHKAAGGMTSIYRQLGIGCERLLRKLIQDAYALTDEHVSWSYEYEKENGVTGRHSLDARIDVAHIVDAQARNRVLQWLRDAGNSLRLNEDRIIALRGILFEVRQGYKSADSKRQNADLRFGLRSYNENYLPVLMIASTQVSAPVCRRYRGQQMLVLLGTQDGNEVNSTFTFYRDVIRFDLAGFFQRNAQPLRAEVNGIVQALLRPD